MGTLAYRREIGLCEALRPKYHLERDDTGHALCSSRTRLDKSTGMPPSQVSGVESCMRAGCKQGWDRVDNVATYLLSEKGPR